MVDVLIDMKILSGSRSHPQADILVETVIRDKWRGFKKVIGKYVVVLDFLG